jgi:hypothetical protein
MCRIRKINQAAGLREAVLGQLERGDPEDSSEAEVDEDDSSEAESDNEASSESERGASDTDDDLPAYWKNLRKFRRFLVEKFPQTLSSGESDFSLITDEEEQLEIELAACRILGGNVQDGTTREGQFYTALHLEFCSECRMQR